MEIGMEIKHTLFSRFIIINNEFLLNFIVVDRFNYMPLWKNIFSIFYLRILQKVTLHICFLLSRMHNSGLSVW